MNSTPTEELDAQAPQEQLELAKRELKAALIFAKFSSTAYSLGRLQHATDARSKAKAACDSAAQRLATRQLMEVGLSSVKSIWDEVQSVLAALPAHQNFLVRTAASE